MVLRKFYASDIILPVLIEDSYLRYSREMEEEDSPQENGIQNPRDSDRQLRLRLCVLNEILSTERDYVRILDFLQSVSFI